MQPTAKSLTLDLLSTQRDGSMPVRALVEAAALFGIAANNVRVTLARLLAAGLVKRDARGCYRVGPRAAAVNNRIASWRRHPEKLTGWNGDWLAVHRTRRPGRSTRAAAGRSARALRLLGFRELEAGLEIRPDNLTGGIDATREQLRALGLEPGAVVAGLHGLDDVTEQRARRLWDAGALCGAYADARRRLAASAARVPGLATHEAMVETFLVGGSVLRQLVVDPLLPDAIVPTAERQALHDDMRAYDRLGRSCWAQFLAGFGVPHLQNPVDLRVTDATGMGLSLTSLESTETGT